MSVSGVWFLRVVCEDGVVEMDEWMGCAQVVVVGFVGGTGVVVLVGAQEGEEVHGEEILTKSSLSKPPRSPPKADHNSDVPDSDSSVLSSIAGGVTDVVEWGSLFVTRCGIVRMLKERVISLQRDGSKIQGADMLHMALYNYSLCLGLIHELFHRLPHINQSDLTRQDTSTPIFHASPVSVRIQHP